MDSQCDAKDVFKEQLTTITPEVIYDPYQYQQNSHKLFNGYTQDGTQVKEELSVNKSAIDIHGNVSYTQQTYTGLIQMNILILQYDLNSGQTTIKPEPLCDQSHPCISALHDKASDGTVFEGEAPMCNPTVNTNHDNVFVTDNMQMPQSGELTPQSLLYSYVCQGGIMLTIHQY